MLLSSETKSLFENTYLMADTAPFTHQHRAGLHDARRCRSQRRPVSAVMGELCQQALRRGLEAAEGFFLEAICDRARQERPADIARRRLSEHGLPARAEFINTQLRQARNFRREGLTVQNRCLPLHDRCPRYFATFSSASKLICGPPRGARFATPMTHTHCSIRSTEPVVRGGRLRAMSALTRSRLLCCDSHSPSNRLNRADATMLANSQLFSFCANEVGKIWGKPLASRADQSKHPDEPLRLKEIEREWNTRNWRRKAGVNCRSDTPHLRPGPPGKRLTPQGRSGRRWAASRNQRNWFAAIAGATTWLRVSSSGGIADAASVSANAMGRRHGRGRRRSSSSLATTWKEGPGRKG